MFAENQKNNKVSKNVNSPNASLQKTNIDELSENSDDEVFEAIGDKGLTASQLIEKYKSNSYE